LRTLPDTTISGNDQLMNITGFLAATSASNLTISGANLTNVDGLFNLKSVSKTLAIIGTSKFVSVAGNTISSFIYTHAIEIYHTHNVT
jgi:hypothetical protein